MQKTLSLSVLAAAALVMAASAHAGVTAEVGTTHQNLSNGFGNHHVHTASVLADVRDGHQLGVSARSVDAWGAEANELSVRSVNKVSQRMTLDTELTLGDSDGLTPENRLSTMAKVQVNENWQLGAGVGYSKYGLGVDALTWKGGVVYKLDAMPLAVGADIAWSDDLYSLGNESRWSVNATYGTVGKWTVSARYEKGAALFDTMLQPAVDSKRLDVEGRYWVGKDWGVKAGAAQVRNSVYKSNELRASVFFAL